MNHESTVLHLVPSNNGCTNHDIILFEGRILSFQEAMAAFLTTLRVFNHTQPHFLTVMVIPSILLEPL